MDPNDPDSPQMFVYDIDYLAIYCPKENKSYGTIRLWEFIWPKDVNYENNYFRPLYPTFYFNPFLVSANNIILLCW